MLHVEWCSKPSARGGVMIPVTELPKLERSSDAGFRSVYEFDDAAAKEINSSGSSKNLARFEPHSDVLFIDLDNGDKDVARVREWAKSCGANVALYTSGSKGYHAHISIAPMSGQDVPYSQSNFVSGLGIEADDSLYRVSSLIALPGRLHPKTRVKKALVETIAGAEITIPLLKCPIAKTAFDGFVEESSGFRVSLLALYSASLTTPKTGNRYITLWKLAKMMCERGVGMDYCWHALNQLNQNWPNPKEGSEVDRAVKEGYKS